MSDSDLEFKFGIEWGEGVEGLHAFVDTIKGAAEAVGGLETNAKRASEAWGALKEAGEEVEKIGRAYRNVVGPFEDVAAKVVELTEGVVSYAREGQRLDAATRSTGLNFQQAARSGSAFVSSVQASTSAMRLHQAGLRLTQEQMNALIAVSTDYATKTGTEVTQAVEQLTDALLGGEQEGLRRFGTSLGMVGGDAHTADERLQALTETANNLGVRVEDIGLRFERAKGNMQEFAREASTGFVTGFSQAMARGDAAAARFIERENEIGIRWREVFQEAGHATEGLHQALMLIPDALNVALSGLAALEGNVDSFTRAVGGLRETWARMRASFAEGAPSAAAPQSGATPTFEAPAPGQDLGAFGQRMLASLRSTVADARQAILDPVKFIDRQLGEGSDIMAGARKFKRGNGDPLASLERAIALTRQLGQVEQSDLERSNALRRREVELLQMGAATEHERLRLVEVERSERERAAREAAAVAQSELDRLSDLEAVINRRMETAGRRTRVRLTGMLQEIEAEQRALQGRLEDAAAAGRRVGAERQAERDREAREAVDRGIEVSRRFDRQSQGFRGAAGDRVDELRAQRNASRTARALEEQLNREESFNDRMRELHRERIDVTGETVAFTEKAYGALSDSLATHFQAIAEGSETVGFALQSVLSEVLKALAKEAFVKSAFYLAEGVASLVSYQYDRAAESFAASALFAGAGALASAGAGAVAPSPPSKPAAPSGGGREARERAPSVGKVGGDGGGTNVVNVMFGGPMYGTGGVRQSARELAGVLNRGAVQGGVQLNLGRAGAGGAN